MASAASAQDRFRPGGQPDDLPPPHRPAAFRPQRRPAAGRQDEPLPAAKLGDDLGLEVAKAGSPSSAKICAIDLPARRSISMSASIHGQPSRSASTGPASSCRSPGSR